MEVPIVAAIIGGVCTIVSPFMTLLIRQHLENRSKLPISSVRRRAIDGCWKGIAQQYQGPDEDPIIFAVTMTLSAGPKRISGTLIIDIDYQGKTEKILCNVSGGFFYERFLKLSYTPSDEMTIQFGSVVLQLDAGGQSLQGKYSGYGKLTNSTVFGTLELKKIA